jgi:hypothetical protein
MNELKNKYPKRVALATKYKKKIMSKEKMYRYKKCKMMTILVSWRHWTPVPAPGFQLK